MLGVSFSLFRLIDIVWEFSISDIIFFFNFSKFWAIISSNISFTLSFFFPFGISILWMLKLQLLFSKFPYFFLILSHLSLSFSDACHVFHLNLPDRSFATGVKKGRKNANGGGLANLTGGRWKSCTQVISIFSRKV